MNINETISLVSPLNEAAMEKAVARQSQLAKPPGSLGRLEELSVQMAGITGKVHNKIEKSHMAGYNAVVYAKDILQNSSNPKMKSLVVAMLNYGAAAQVHFDYKADSLMNAFLTEEQKALVSEYSADMVQNVVRVDSSKLDGFAATSGSYSYLYPNVVFEGAFAINFYFAPSMEMDGNLTLYYWDLDDYNSAGILTAQNASGSVVMEPTSVQGEYLGTVKGIAAKEINQTVFVAGVYESNEVTRSTGVIAYSLSAYCQDRIANGTDTMKPFAACTAVYGYYAKEYFAGIA